MKHFSDWFVVYHINQSLRKASPSLVDNVYDYFVGDTLKSNKIIVFECVLFKVVNLCLMGLGKMEPETDWNWLSMDCKVRWDPTLTKDILILPSKQLRPPSPSHYLALNVRLPPEHKYSFYNQECLIQWVAEDISPTPLGAFTLLKYCIWTNYESEWFKVNSLFPLQQF